MSRLYALLFLLLAASARADMLSMDNESLAKITGQDGIGLALEWRLNADANGVSKCGVSIPLLECRIALSFNNRGTAGSNQEWLVLKGVSGRVVIPYLALDASTVTYSNDSNAATTIPAAKFGFDPNNPLRIQNFTVANLAWETDTSTTARGYMTASEGGFLGLRIDDSNSVSTPTTPFVGLQLSGSIKMFPCNADHKLC